MTTRRTLLLGIASVAVAPKLPSLVDIVEADIDKVIAGLIAGVKQKILSGRVARVIGSWGQVLGETDMAGVFTKVTITTAGVGSFLKIFDGEDNELFNIPFEANLLPDDSVWCNVNTLDMP